MLYKFWLYYYIFVKKIYKRRWNDMNSSVFALAFACLFIICLFTSVALEFLLNFNGFMHLLDKGLPLSAIAILLGFIILFPLTLILNKLAIKNKVGIIKMALIKTKKISRTYTIIYLAFCSILFLLTIMVVIINKT